MSWLKENWMKIFLISILLLPSVSFAHPGRTASDGCHYCRTNCDKWGVTWNARHCHASKSVPQPSEPIRSHYDESGGYTTPAPDYKTPVTKPIPSIKVEETKPTTSTEEEEIIVPVSNTSNSNQAAASVNSITREKEHWFIRFFRWLF